MYACVRSARVPELAKDVAAQFSPRLQRYGAEAVVFDVSGLGRLLGPPDVVAAEIAHAARAQLPALLSEPSAFDSGGGGAGPPRFVSRYGLRVQAHPTEHGRVCSTGGALPEDVSRTLRDRELRLSSPESRAPGPGKWLPLRRAGIRVTVAPTQVCALLLSLAGEPTAVVIADEAGALAPLPLRRLQQLLAGIHGVTVLRGPRAGAAPGTGPPGWPAWPACAKAFDMLQRWGVRTLGEFAALPAAELSARMGQAGVALQLVARGRDPHPLVPDPEVPRFVERMELEWPIDGLEPLSFVLARLLDPLSGALERADRAAAAIRLELRLVDRTTHVRVLQLPAALREARVLRTLLLLDLESHPPAAAIDVVRVEADPAPGRVVQYSLLERATASVETLATLTARLGALVGEARCGTPVLLETHRPDAFELRRFDGGGRAAAVSVAGPAIVPALRRFRPPVAVRVRVDRGRPAHVAIDRRGMPGGEIVQAAGPWRTSGGWWTREQPWDRDEWDVELRDGTVCRLHREQGVWFMEGVMD